MAIIPNWHPIFVHFTVGLLITAALLHVAHRLLSNSEVKGQCAIVARWNLWIGAVFAVFTVIAGFLAYNSVDHDTPSHIAMTLHKNWALGTLAAILIVTIWSFISHRKNVALPIALTIAVLVSSGLLAATAWHGGELVYRYGLGVKSLPKADTHGHDGTSAHSHDHDGASAHSHGDEHASHDANPAATQHNADELAPHESHSHEDSHSHDDNHSHEDSHAHEDNRSHEDNLSQ